MSAPGPDVYRKVARDVRKRLAADGRLVRNLPDDGRIFFDRALPFIALYRRPPGRDDRGTAELLQGLSSYFIASGEKSASDGVGDLLGQWAHSVAAELGACLILELWSSRGVPVPDEDGGGVGERQDLDVVHEPVRAEPTVRIHASDSVPASLVGNLGTALRELEIRPDRGGDLGVPPQLAEVTVRMSSEPVPDDLLPLDFDDPTGAFVRIGLEVSPFYRTPDGTAPFPRVVHAFRAGLAKAVEDSLFPWTQDCTTLDVPHARSLARANIGRPSRLVDERLAEVYESFDLLMQVTPVNSDQAWERFKDDGYDGKPDFVYRPLPFDPENLKRRLFDVPIEKVEDPLLADLFREKQEELDRQITLLRDIGTPDFVHSSRLLYGPVDDDLVRLAEDVLGVIPDPAERDRSTSSGRVGAEAFLERAEEEIKWYRAVNPGFRASAEIRDDIASGLVVSKGTLCISKDLSLPAERVDALLQHEVGTHLVTYCNGETQPFRLLSAGLAGYDPLQEGLAVLAEYLVGGLTPGRARTLAARVIGVRGMLDGRPFADNWRHLVESHGFGKRTAFGILVRVYRGGGLVKDALYLAGLRDLLAYLADDQHSIEPLFMGKVALGHVDAVQELVLRGILQTPSNKPHWMNNPDALERLDACRSLSVMKMIEEIAA